MIPINNSDTAWLIITDYNQDNSLPYEDLLQDIYCPSINEWFYEYQLFDLASGSDEGDIADGNEYGDVVGEGDDLVGDYCDMDDFCLSGQHVGGHASY
jgi:hypothetical protein